MIDRRGLDDLAESEARDNVVDQQTAAEAGLDQATGDSGTPAAEATTDAESEAHPS